MKKYIFIGISVLTILAVLGWQNAWAGIVVVDSYDVTDSGDYGSIDDTTNSFAQSFTSTNQTILDSAKFYLAKHSSPTGSAYAKIYAHSGTYGTNSVPTGSVLATSDAFDVSTLSTSMQLITFNFTGANRITLNASTYYEVVIYYNLGDSTNYLKVFRKSDGLHSGNFSYYDSIWETDPTIDLNFYVYGDNSGGGATPTPHSSLISSNTSTFINNASVILP